MLWWLCLAGSENARGKKSDMAFYTKMKLFAARMLRKLFGNNWRLLRGLSLISRGVEVLLRGDHTFRSISLDSPERPTGFGINIVGYATSEFGLAAAARGTIRAVETLDIPYVVNSVETTAHTNLDVSVNNLSSQNPYSINLIHMNPIEADGLRQAIGDRFFGNRYNIGYWFWELSELPDEWLHCFADYDEIWVGSNFCLAMVSKVSPIPVTKIAPCVHLDESTIDASRSRFGLRDDNYIFFFMFDFRSSLQRKNPLALVKAFRLAFESKKDVTLVLKFISSPHFSRERQALVKAASEANVKLIDTNLGQADLYSLLASCDCYVSLHRSEGFGLPIAEAMYLGKPVIATGYSGNMDFMNANNSFAVKFKLVEVGQNDYLMVKKGAVWAEPDIEHAAELMRFVYENREYAAKIGKRASDDIRTLFSPAVTGREIQMRLATIGHKHT
jgi:glycosyltransferase involved in cell wall biosynthesis